MPAGRAGIFYSSSIHRAASFAVTLQLCLRRPTFSVASEPRPLVRFHRNCRAYGNAATVAPRAYFFCCARKSRQKDALGDAPYCALPRAIFIYALFGRRIATVPMAFGADKCTTRSLGQTAIIPFLLISGILGRLRYCTACCRGRCRHRPLQTYMKDEQGRQSRPPLQRFAIERKYWAPSAHT